jgi:hypothetical protein
VGDTTSGWQVHWPEKLDATHVACPSGVIFRLLLTRLAENRVRVVRRFSLQFRPHQTPLFWFEEMTGRADGPRLEDRYLKLLVWPLKSPLLNFLVDLRESQGLRASLRFFFKRFLFS